MRMVDLRPAGAATNEPTLTLRASPAAEYLRLLGVLVDQDERLPYDIGAERIRRLRDGLPDGALARLHDVDDQPKTFHVLSLLAADLPEPGGIDDLLALLHDDPSAGWRLLLGHNAAGGHGRGDATLAERIAAGDDEAIAEVASWADDGELPRAIERLLSVDPETHGRALVDAIHTARPTWDEVEDESLSAMTRDAAYRQQQREDGASVADIVVEATNGYALPTDVVTTEVVLMPTYWLRPWIVVARHGTTELLTSIVADEFLALPSEAPSPALLKLFKALSDEGRLKLLRRMSTGPISLTEACEELDVAKATAHHHLATLRQAGLVVLQGEGRDKRYGLRADPPDAARDALAAYVQPSR